MANKFYVLLLPDGSLEIANKPWNEVQKISRKNVKGFKTESEAKSFIKNGAFDDVSANDDKPKTVNGVIEYAEYIKSWDKSNPYAFTDGSFNTVTNVYGCGGYLVINNEKHIIKASGIDKEMASMRNVAGEILGSMKAIELAIENNVSHLTLFYDYEGIQRWVDGSWQAKNDCTKFYKEFMLGIIDAGMKIDFVHSKGHSGIDGNEEADKLAKEAVGLE